MNRCKEKTLRASARSESQSSLQATQGGGAELNAVVLCS
jgi:hypothetical protein